MTNYEAKARDTKRASLEFLAAAGINLPASIDGVVAHNIEQTMRRLLSYRDRLESEVCALSVQRDHAIRQFGALRDREAATISSLREALRGIEEFTRAALMGAGK